MIHLKLFLFLTSTWMFLSLGADTHLQEHDQGQTNGQKIGKLLRTSATGAITVLGNLFEDGFTAVKLKWKDSIQEAADRKKRDEDERERKRVESLKRIETKDRQREKEEEKRKSVENEEKAKAKKTILDKRDQIFDEEQKILEELSKIPENEQSTWNLLRIKFIEMSRGIRMRYYGYKDTSWGEIFMKVIDFLKNGASAAFAWLFACKFGLTFLGLLVTSLTAYFFGATVL